MAYAHHLAARVLAALLYVLENGGYGFVLGWLTTELWLRWQRRRRAAAWYADEMQESEPVPPRATSWRPFLGTPDDC